MILLYDITFFDSEERVPKHKLLRFLPFLLALGIIPLITMTNQQNAEVRIEELAAVPEKRHAQVFCPAHINRFGRRR